MAGNEKKAVTYKQLVEKYGEDGAKQKLLTYYGGAGHDSDLQNGIEYDDDLRAFEQKHGLNQNKPEIDPGHCPSVSGPATGTVDPGHSQPNPISDDPQSFLPKIGEPPPSGVLAALEDGFAFRSDNLATASAAEGLGGPVTRAKNTYGLS